MSQEILRQLGGGFASDAGVIDLRAVAFWSLAKRERLWAEDEVGRFQILCKLPPEPLLVRAFCGFTGNRRCIVTGLFLSPPGLLAALLA